MNILLTVLLVVLGVAWVWMLIDSFRRAEFPTQIVHDSVTPWFWRIALLLVNPLTVVAYAVLVKWRIRALGDGALNRSLAVALVGLAVVLQWGLFGTARSDSLGFTGKVSGIGTSYSRSEYGGGNSLAPTPMRRVRITSFGEHALIARTRGTLEERLNRLPFVEDVATTALDPADPLRAGSTVATTNHRAPDIDIALSLHHERDWILPGYHAFSGTFRAEVSHGTGPTGVVHQQRDPRVDLNSLILTLELEFDYDRTGFALGAGIYGEVASSLDEALGKHLVEMMRKAQAVGGTAPDLPGALDPEPAPTIPALADRDARLLRLEHGPFVHTRAHYVIPTAEPSETVLAEMAEKLTSDGWKQRPPRDAGDRQFTEFTRGEERLSLGRWPLPPKKSPGMSPIRVDADGKPITTRPKPDPERHPGIPIHAVYKKRFDRKRIEQVAAKLHQGEAGPDPRALYIVQRHLDKTRRKALRDTLATLPIGTPAAFVTRNFVLAEEADRDKEAAEARVYLRRAFVLWKTANVPSNMKKKFEKLAKKLEAPLDPPKPGELEECGLTRLSVDPPSELQLDMGDSATLLSKGDDDHHTLLVLSPREVRGDELVLHVATRSRGGGSWGDRNLELRAAAPDQSREIVPYLIGVYLETITLDGTVEPGGKRVRLRLSVPKR